MIDGTDGGRDQKRLRINDGEEHACRKDQQTEGCTRSCFDIVIDGDQSREVNQRDEKSEIRDDQARDEITIVTATKGAALSRMSKGYSGKYTLFVGTAP